VIIIGEKSGSTHQSTFKMQNISTGMKLIQILKKATSMIEDLFFEYVDTLK